MQWLKDYAASAKSKLAQFNNSTFKDALMASCALVACADGKLDAKEEDDVVRLIQTNEMLSVFDAGELGRTFKGFCVTAKDKFSRLDLFTKIRGLKNNPAQGELCLRVAIIIANSDGNFAPEEKDVVKELCLSLGLDPAPYVA
jgi:tellurite resistance protein TerB